MPLLVLAGALGGCTTTQTDLSRGAHHFTLVPSEKQQQADCMADMRLVNNRSSVIAPAAIEGAWVYCKRYSDFWYPGQDDEQNGEDQGSWLDPR